MPDQIRIRLATSDDLPAINAIYNHYVKTSLCTYQEQPESIESRRAWFGRHGDLHPITVAEVENEIVAWASISPFHARSAYRFTVEDSVYVRHDLFRRGIGSALLLDLIQRARAAGHRTIIALIDSTQTGSIALHEHHGFVRCAHLSEVGFKFGRWSDVVYLQLSLQAATPPPRS